MRKALEPSLVNSVYDQKARRYDAQHAIFTLKADQRGRRMVVHHGVAPGDRVLDAGGGTGSGALLAAARAGPQGKVVVFDFSEGMLAVARDKAARAGLADRMEFRTGDILHLPFGDDAFDAVISTYSICPLYDPVAGALELYRVVKPGGRLAVAHSTEPANRVVRWLAGLVEGIVWRFPSLSMGCRPVETLAAIKQAGGIVLFETTIGFPLWPFIVYAVRKPAESA